MKISGIDSQGQRFSEQTRTVVVNEHGALVLSAHALAPGSEVELSAFQETAQSRARVVRIAGKNKLLGGWEVAAELSVPGNFWRINFPPEDWEEAAIQPARTEEQSAGLRPRPAAAASMPAVAPKPAAAPQRPSAPLPAKPMPAPAAVRPAEKPAPAPAPTQRVADPATTALQAVEAAANGAAMSPEDRLQRFQIITGALLRALMRRGLLTEKELRDALESVEKELPAVAS